MAAKVPTLRLELFVPGMGPDLAFDQLVSELETALPLVGYRLESGPNGRMVEVRSSGGEREFARIMEWERGQRIAFSWHPADPGATPASVPVAYEFERFDSGTKITIEYGEWVPSTPISEGAERVGWFASGVLPSMIRATAPLGFGDWWTDRVARRPSGASSRKVYADPLFHRPNFLLILDRLHLTANDRLLEVGCGGGAFLHVALESGCRAWAIDHSPDMVRLAREKNQEAIQEHRAEIVEGDAHHLPFASASCTCAVTTGSFGFWDRPVEGLSEVRRVLEPGGRFILFTGTKELRGTPAAPEPVASRVHWYEDDEIAELARAAGFVDVRVDRPDFGAYARKAALPPEVAGFFESGPPSGQVLEARRPPD
jgi:SAM-dependent methyltransferase